MTRGATRGRRVLLVADPWQRGMLAAARCLALAGHEVHIAGSEPGHAATSRHCARHWLVPSLDHRDFSAGLARAVRMSGAEVVFGCDDEHVLELTRDPSVVAPARLGHPPSSTVRRALDKVDLAVAAARAGFAVPHQVSRLPEDDSGPWIAKRRRYRPGDTHEHLLADELDDDADGGNWVYQRVVEGDLWAIVLLADGAHRLRYAGAQRAHRVYPEPFGVSVRARTAPLPAAWRQACADLVAELGWWGVAEVQVVVDRWGTPHLIDFNGRFFGSLSLTDAAGADLASATLAIALSEDPGDHSTPAPGLGYQWLEGDLRRAWARPRGERWREVASSLAWAPRAKHSIFRLSDPGPSARHVVRLVGRGLPPRGK